MKNYKNMSLKKTTFFLFALSIAGNLMAQDSVVTLQKLWQEAESNSQRIKVKQAELNSAEQGIITAENGKLPDIDVSLSLGYLGNGFLTDRDFSNSMTVENPHFMNGFAIKASQLVYGGGVIKNSVKAAEIGRDLAQFGLDNERQEVRMMIAGYYLDICRLRNQTTVLDDNLKLCDTLIKNMKVMEQQGTALSNDILRYEFQREGIILAKRKVSDALQIVYRRIATATHHEGKNDFTPDTAMLSVAVDFLADSSWQNAAVSGNIGLKMAETDVLLKEQQLKITKSNSLPKVAVIAEDHFDGPITIEVPVIDKNFNYWFAGAGIQYNISSIYKNKREIKHAEIQLENSRERYSLALEQMGDNVQAAYIDLLTSNAEIDTQLKSTELAGKNYKVTLSRYNNGLATITDMLDAANTKLDAELNLVNSKINLLYNYFKLKYISSSL